jgi:hypothetical protein
MSNGSTHLSSWVSKGTKQRFGGLAEALGLSESALLKRSVQLQACARAAPRGAAAVAEGID